MGYNATVNATSGIVGHWRLDESSGPVTDVINSDTATTNAGVTLNSTGLVGNDTDTAIVFNGTTGVLTVSATAEPRYRFTNTQAWSFECFFNLTSASTTNGIVSTLWSKFATDGTSRGQEVGLQYVTSFGWQVKVYNIGTYSTSTIELRTNTTSLIALSTTYHLVVTNSGSGLASGIKIYLNNALITTRVTDHDNLTTTASGTQQPTIGSRTDASSFFKGTIDEPAIYNVALSSATVASHYQAQSGTVTVPNRYSAIISNAASYYALDEQSGPIAIDSIGSCPLTYASSGVTYNQTSLNNSGSAIAFDGSTGQATGTVSPVTSATSTTIEAWFKTSNTAQTHQCIFYNGVDGTSGYGILLNGFSGGYTTDGTIFVLVGATWIGTSVKITNTLKHHIALVMTVTHGFIVYLDGTAIYTDSSTVATAPSGFFGIGNKTNTGSFNGTIDEVVVYNRVVSAAEISSHYNNTPALSSLLMSI